VWRASTFARARRPIAIRSVSSISCRQRSVSLGVRAMSLSESGVNRVSRPSQASLMIGVPHAAASKSRTLGDHPAATMSARVTFSVNRCAL
jgi:hypothetical protein